MYDKLVTLGLRKEGEFTLHSGAKSNVFWNIEELYNYPEWVRVEAIKEFIWKIGVVRPGRLIGIRTGGLLLAHDIGKQLDIYVFNQDGYVEGGNEVGRRLDNKVIIIDDVLTTGGTATKCLERFDNVIAVAVLINRSNRDKLSGTPIITGLYADCI